MPQHLWPINCDGWRWLPPRDNAHLQNLFRRWSIVPHGDSIHGAKSGGVKDQMLAEFPLHDNIVAVLILHKNLENHTLGRLLQAPLNYFFKSRERPHLGDKSVRLRISEVRMIGQGRHGQTSVHRMHLACGTVVISQLRAR